MSAIYDDERDARAAAQREEDEATYWRCVLCENWNEGWGNNPEPLASYDDGRCCDICNYTQVIPARLGRITA